MVARYIFNLLLGLDQFVNVLALGDPDESISGRLGRAHVSKKPKFFVEPLRKLVDTGARLLAGQRDHCVQSIEAEDQIYSKELWTWIKE